MNAARRRVWKHRLTVRGKFVLATAVGGAYVVAVAAAALAIVASAAAPEDRAVVRRVVGEQGGPLFWGAVVAVALLGGGLWVLVQRYLARPRALAASARLIASANPAHRLAPGGPLEIHQLATAVNELADRYQAERADVVRRVDAARADLAAERNRLAALMSELTVAVLVCSAEGRILLYNAAASQLLNGPGTVGGPVGLGRSVFAVLDRDLVAYALDRSTGGEDAGAAYTATVAHGDALLRARVAPVAEPDRPGSTGGFVVTLEDLTREAAAADHQSGLVRSLSADSRAAVANIRAAAESVLDYPDMPAEQTTRFLTVIAGEAAALSERLDTALSSAPAHLDRRLAAADLLGRDLLDAVARRLRAAGLDVTADDALDGARPLWLFVDGYAVVRALGHLGRLLADEHRRRAVHLRLERSGRYAGVDLSWSGPAVPARTLDRWINTPVDAAVSPSGGSAPAAGAGGLSCADVLQRHGGEIWSDEDGGDAHLRVLLPLAEHPPAEVHAPAGRAPRGSAPPARTAAYDFSLLEPEGGDGGWDARPLERLAYTVFDTETTGLFPTQGDEIISIGALRVLNRRLLRQETYEQLVDPHRTVPESSVRIHGITPDLLAGMPAIDAVLPGFAGFAADTVLVGHNVAFDLQFLRAKEASSGVRFDQPVLDTLLLSAVVHPEHESHALDAIAERLGIDIIGRHTALGDAIVTGEIFLRMLELLAERGITTLGEARRAARKVAAERFGESMYTHT